MSLYRKKISAGIHYNHLSTDRFKTGYLSVNFILPLNRDTVAYYALLPRVLRCGCQSFPNRRTIVKRLEELYGADIYARHYGRGDKQIISFSADFLDNAFLPQDETVDVLQGTLAVLKELVLSPVMREGSFLPEYVENECRNCADTVRSMINHKQQYAIHRCMTLMCENEVAGIPILGTVEDFDHIDPIKLVNCYYEMLRHAQIEIFYVGSATIPVVQFHFTDFFTKINRFFNEAQPFKGTPRCATAVHTYEETTTAVQGKLILGFRTGVLMHDREQLAYSLFNEVYGGSPSSKLFLNVREKKSLCYSCYASADMLKGIMLVIAGIDNEQRDVAVEEILFQLDKMRQTDITEEELHCAKQSLANGYRSLYDSAEGLEAWYLRRILANCLLTPEEAAEHVMAFTVQDIAAIARGVSLDTIYFLRGEMIPGEDEGDDDDE